MLAGTNRTAAGRIVAGAFQHRVLAPEGGTSGGWSLGSPIRLWRVDRGIQRRDPSFGIRFVADCGHDQQIACSRRRDVSDALSFLLLAAQLALLRIGALLRRPATDAQDAQRCGGVDVTAGYPGRQTCDDIREDDDVKL